MCFNTFLLYDKLTQKKASQPLYVFSMTQHSILSSPLERVLVWLKCLSNKALHRCFPMTSKSFINYQVTPFPTKLTLAIALKPRAFSYIYMYIEPHSSLTTWETITTRIKKKKSVKRESARKMVIHHPSFSILKTMTGQKQQRPRVYCWFPKTY